MHSKSMKMKLELIIKFIKFINHLTYAAILNFQLFTFLPKFEVKGIRIFEQQIFSIFMIIFCYIYQICDIQTKIYLNLIYFLKYIVILIKKL